MVMLGTQGLIVVFVPLLSGCISSLIKTDHSLVHLRFLKFVKTSGRVVAKHWLQVK